MDAIFFERLADGDLAAHHADRSGERARGRHDLVGRHRHVVAAAGRSVPKARHHRLRRSLRLPPDQVAGQSRPPWRIDPQHDRGHLVVLRRIANRLDDAVGSSRPAAEQLVLALPFLDLPREIDDCDLLVLACGRSLLLARQQFDELHEPTDAGEIVIHFLLRVVAGDLRLVELDAANEAADHLVFVGHGVDQLRLEGRLGREHTGVDQCADLIRGQLPIGGDPLHELLVEIADELFVLSAELRAHARPRERLPCPLELSHLQDLGIDVELVEHRLEEGHLRPHAGDLERGRRRHSHRVAGRRHDIVHRIASNEVRGHRLASLADAADRCPQFLGASTTYGRRFDRQHHPLHPRVGGRFVEPLNEPVQVRRHIGQQSPLTDPIGDRSRQRDLGDHRRLLLGSLIGGLGVFGIFVSRAGRWFGGRRLPMDTRRRQRGQRQQQGRQTARAGNTGTADGSERAWKAENVMHGGATPKKTCQRT